MIVILISYKHIKITFDFKTKIIYHTYTFLLYAYKQVLKSASCFMVAIVNQAKIGVKCIKIEMIMK